MSFLSAHQESDNTILNGNSNYASLEHSFAKQFPPNMVV